MAKATHPTLRDLVDRTRTFGEFRTESEAVRALRAVCRSLGEVLPDEVLDKLGEALPASLVELFHPYPEGEAPPHRMAASARRHTLATGRPGSSHPLSEAKPPDAHQHSVANEDNPHAETKLSSARGLTQERLEESMATAKPETRRRIGESSD